MRSLQKKWSEGLLHVGGDTLKTGVLNILRQLQKKDNQLQAQVYQTLIGCKTVRDQLLAAGVPAGDILCVGGLRPNTLAASIKHEKTVHLSENAVINGDVNPYKIAIVPKTKCTGYSMAWMTCMITGSYPSNQADRTQMKGRINRLDCQRLHKNYITVLAGTTTITYHHQAAAAMMEKALRQTAAKRTPKKQKKNSNK
jgi:hypothetical protein